MSMLLRRYHETEIEQPKKVTQEENKQEDKKSKSKKVGDK